MRSVAAPRSTAGPGAEIEEVSETGDRKREQRTGNREQGEQLDAGSQMPFGTQAG
jgi:hypothetical protein